MLNHITVMGRLTRDPELRRTGSGVSVANFTLAVERDFTPKDAEKEVDFIDCVAWRQTGEFVSKYFTKGRMAVVDGWLQIRGWTDKEGTKRRTAEVVADHVYFGDSKREETNGTGSGAYTTTNTYNPTGGGYSEPQYSPPAYPEYPAYDFAMLEDDDGKLPF